MVAVSSYPIAHLSEPQNNRNVLSWDSSIQIARRKILLDLSVIILLIKASQQALIPLAVPERSGSGQNNANFFFTYLIFSNSANALSYQKQIASTLDADRFVQTCVTAQSCSGTVFNHFMGKFECSSSSQTPNKMAEQKEESCLDAATIVNKEAAAHGQKEERCLDAATIVNKEVAAHALLSSLTETIETQKRVLQTSVPIKYMITVGSLNSKEFNRSNLDDDAMITKGHNNLIRCYAMESIMNEEADTDIISQCEPVEVSLDAEVQPDVNSLI
nr:hypothetical protein [Tanacetum cinerariifolium]